MIFINYLIICLIFGTTFLAIKVGVDHAAPPFFSAGIRFLTGGLVLFLFMAWRKKARFALLLRKEMLLTGIGLTFGTFAFLYWAEQYVPSGIAAVLSATGPLMILLLQMAVLRQTASPRSAIGIVVGFAGVVLLVLPSLTVSSAGKWWGIGCLAILTGQVFYASGALYSKQVILRFPEASPIALNAAQMMYGGGLLLLLSLFTERVDLRELASPSVAVSLLYLTVVGSMVGHSLFYWLVAKTNPVFPSTWLYVSPLIALAIGVGFYGETAGWATVAGAVTIIAGTVLSNLDGLRQLLRKPALAKTPSPASAAAGGPGTAGKR
ncbi:DMT family transporter [Paenibacillus macerans]|uniref:DMT family transporter n=1 Tax=Paenibacillus macerans TaxID=44252 RepID=UPI003D31EE42